MLVTQSHPIFGGEKSDFVRGIHNLRVIFLNKPLKTTKMNRLIYTLLVITSFTATCCSQTLYIYEGQNHDEYLGCLNCNNYEKNLIWN